MMKKSLSLLLALAMLLGMIPGMGITAMAAESPYGVKAESAVAGDLTCTVDNDGVLTWTDLPGATSYDLNIYMKGGLVKSETALTSASYDLETMLDHYKKDSGTVEVHINVRGGTGRGGSANFLYSSPYPKLEAPTMLAWSDRMAMWNAVSHADNYQVWLYQPSGSAYSHWDTSNTYFNFTDIPAVANMLGDGWFFTVKATSAENYRDSEFNESGRRGYTPAGGLRAESKRGELNKLTFTVDGSGVLTWDEVPGASGYALSIRHDGDYFMSVSAMTPSCDLQELLEEYRKDHGTVEISITPDGENSLAYRDVASFLYSSPYGKLEAPTGLMWDGNIADWNDVPYANGYTIYLYQPGGSAYNHWTITDSQFDFSDVAAPGGDWYYQVKATAEEGTRDSAFTESLRKSIYAASQVFPIGVYAYDDTYSLESAGGEVYLETAGGDFSWSSEGYTEDVQAGTYVTAKARPADGYRFVEWRQGTKGDTISTNSIYSFTCTGPRYLYAIFEQGDPNETVPITGVSLSGLSVPVVGEPIQYVDGSDLTEDPSGRNKYRVIDNQTSSWRDEEGRAINYGAQVFEAGRTYSINFNVDPKDGYAFTSEDIPVTLTNLYAHAYIGSIELSQETSVATVTFTFTLPGERTYADIVNFRFYEMRAPKDGDTVSNVNGVWAYNNSEMTDRYWTNSEGTRLANGIPFVSGRTYYYNYEFAAFDGYKFAENIFVRADNEVPTNWEYTFDNARTTLHIKIPYYIGTSDTVNSVVVNGMFEPNQTKSTRDWDSNVYLRVPNNSNYQIPLQTKSWYEVEAEYTIDTEYKVTEPVFRAGKQYKMFLILHAKDGYKFASPETMSFEFSGISAETYTYTCKSGGSESNIEVVITFTAQFPDDVGSSANNPAMCYSYAEFKYAMESPDIRYVALGDVEDIITKVEGDGLIPAISVNGIKHLNVIGNATFTAPANNDGYKTICALLHCEQGSTLNLSGAGKLTFKAVTNASYNAVVWNQGGSVYVDGATLIGSYNTAVYGKAIWQSYGELRISDGQFFAENALKPGKLPAAHTAVYIDGGKAWIQGGTFKTENKIDTFDLPYGLDIGQYATVDLSGGTYYGILLPTSSTPLANYMDEELYTPLSDESWFNPESEYSQGYVESGKVVRIAWLIDHVDVHINAPIAGVDINENYFNVPTSGCQAAMYYPMWYKNGESVTYGTFEAGASYKVVVKVEPNPGYGIEFTSGITAALNNRNVSLESHGVHYIEFEYDFGVCPDVVPQVDLTVTVPKEGSVPKGAMGGADGATVWDTEWLVSETGTGSYQIMQQGDTFEAGNYYKVRVQMKAVNGYEFPTYDDGVSIMPATSATVNGYYADVKKTYGEEPSEYFDVEYDFGICNDSIIEQIVIGNITAPVAGECPSYSLSIAGSAYASEGDYGFQQKNGMVWADVTNGGGILYDDTKFIAGHTYQVTISLHADEGYEFKTTGGDNIAATTATVNGYPATVKQATNASKWQTVTYQFTCVKKDVSTVMISLDAPQAGKTPDITPTAAYPELYQPDVNYGFGGICWYDEEDNMLSEDDVFEQGRCYKVEVKLIPAQLGGMNVSQFVNSGFKAYINGELVTEQLNWDDVYVSSNAVYIYYTFFKSAAAPEAEKDPIFQWNGDRCTVYGNGSGATMAASYTGGQMKEVVFFKNNTSVSLSGDSVRIFFLNEATYIPIRSEIISVSE